MNLIVRRVKKWVLFWDPSAQSDQTSGPSL